MESHELDECQNDLTRFSIILTGNEEAASGVLSLALETASRHAARRNCFPCARSWLMNEVYVVASSCPEWSISASRETDYPISLLSMPPIERAALVLRNGFGFDESTTGLILAQPPEVVSATLIKAYAMFDRLIRVPRAKTKAMTD